MKIRPPVLFLAAILFASIAHAESTFLDNLRALAIRAGMNPAAVAQMNVDTIFKTAAALPGIINRGAHADRPAPSAANTNTLFYETDTTTTFISDGTTWTSTGGGGGSVPDGSILQTLAATIAPSGPIADGSTAYVDATNVNAVITPSSVSSKVRFQLSGGLYYTRNEVMAVKLFRNGTDLGIVEVLTGPQEAPHSIIFEDTPGVTTTCVYSIQYKSQSSSSVYFHYDLAGFSGIPTGKPPIVITLTEIK